MQWMSESYCRVWYQACGAHNMIAKETIEHLDEIINYMTNCIPVQNSQTYERSINCLVQVVNIRMMLVSNQPINVQQHINPQTQNATDGYSLGEAIVIGSMFK